MTGGRSDPTAGALFDHMAGDPFARRMGIALEEVRPGYARVRMTPDEEMRNFNGSLHGGAIFSLADAALAAASNSHGTVAVGLSVSAQFLSPGAPGVRLVAEAVEEGLGRRTGLYHITVIAEETGVKVAVFHGRVFRLEQPVLK